MKIEAIKIWSQDLGNTRPYTIAFKSVESVSNVFAQIRLANGISGLGAANPSEFVVGESLAHCITTLTEDSCVFLIGRDIRNFNELLSEVRSRFISSPGSRTALDIALHDTFTKYLGIPLVKFLGQKLISLPTSITIGIKDVNETLSEAREYMDRGFKVLKVKLGKNLDDDIERLVKLREQFGSKITLRVDANQGYTFKETISFFEQTRGLELELIEQPMPANAVGEMKALPSEVKEFLAIDESLLTSADALRLAEPPIAGRIFNIKLMKCGGVSEALRIAAIAELAGIELFWGCNDESIISIAAALHAAFSSSQTRYIDLDGSFDLGQDIVTGGFIVKDGVMSCIDSPGLGVELIV